MKSGYNLNIEKLIDLKSKRKNNIRIKKGRSNNGVLIFIDGIKIGIDHWDDNCDVLFISHAHMDHIPYIPNSIIKKVLFDEGSVNFPMMICSDITREIAKLRTKEKFLFPESSWLLGYDLNHQSSIEFKGIKFTILENGHTFGSSSLLIEGSETILYSSEFIIEDRLFKKGDLIKSLKPRRCDHLILDCTFCSPYFDFPSFKDIEYGTNEYIKEQFNEGNPLIFFGYTFGKSQIIMKMLECDSVIYLDKEIGKITEILERFGINFPKWRSFNRNFQKKLKDNELFIIISPPNNLFKDTYRQLINNGAKTAIFSGKVLDASFRTHFNVDNYFPLSDHSDFKSTLNFIDKCNPNNIYLEYGQIENFSYFLSKKYHNKSILTIF